MRLGVSTLGCPAWTLPEIAAHCRSYGYEGIELRGLGPDLDLTQSPDFSAPRAIQESRRLFAEAGLEICGVDSSVRLGDADGWAGNFEHGRRTIDLAAALGSPFVRVFGGDGPVDRAAERLRLLGGYAAQSGEAVAVLLETHDAFSTGAQVAEVLRRADHPRVGALWDLHHPYRQGEMPRQTWDSLRPFVRQTHVKDSAPGGTYCLLGQGDIPIREMLGILHGGGYVGWVNLEWEKRWHPALPEPEVAFPQYAQTLRRYLGELTP